MVHDMTQGGVRRHVVRMMVFVLAGMTAQTLYSLVDIYWVSRLGERAVAAVALSTNLMFVSLALTQMLSVGCVALVSQAAGRKDEADVQRFFNQAQCLSLCAGALFLLLGLVFMESYARLLSGDAETARLARAFLVYFLPSLALQFSMVGLASALRGIGDMKPGLLAQTFSVLFNLVLAPFLIFGWGTGHAMGVAGAALSTLIATIGAVIGLLIYLVRGNSVLRIRSAHLKPDLAVWRRMLGIGLPSGVEFFLMSLNMGVIYVVIRPFGAAAQAGFGIGSRIMQACFMPSVAISFSVAAVVGQNLGARSYTRVREAMRESATLTVAFMLVFMLLSLLIPDLMVGAFTADPRAVEVGSDYLSIIAYNYVAAGLVFVSAGVFQGLGNTWPSLLASLVRSALFVVPVLLLSRAPEFEIHTVWRVSVASVLLQLGLCLYLLRRELDIKAPVTATIPVIRDA